MNETLVFRLAEPYFSWLKRLDELKIPYKENYHGEGISFIVVTLTTETQCTDLMTFLTELLSFINLQKVEAEKAKKKLARMNRWRHFTLRDPLLQGNGSKIPES